LSGSIALHGGGEFLPGDEPFLTALLAAAPRSSDATEIRVAIVPTAAARGRPDLVVSMARAAFEQVASAAGIAVRIEAVPILGAASAGERALIERLDTADVIHLPGGDPDLIPTVFAGTPAERSLREAHARGAVLAGASAGAMALATWTWTPTGAIRGLALVENLIVAPHVGDEAAADRWLERVGESGVPADVAVLGLAERTGVLGHGRSWQVVGPGAAWWRPPGATAWHVARTGRELELGG
jgi:cyanophycinase